MSLRPVIRCVLFAITDHRIVPELTIPVKTWHLNATYERNEHTDLRASLTPSVKRHKGAQCPQSSLSPGVDTHFLTDHRSDHGIHYMFRQSMQLLEMAHDGPASGRRALRRTRGSHPCAI